MTHAADGWPIRRFDWPAVAGGTRGGILWLGGRGDIFEKYLEAFAEWHRAGWAVTSFDWRGQGGSGRLLADPAIGHATDFTRWLDDLTTFWRAWIMTTSGPHILMGHSMGGHLVLRALAERRVAPAAVVLSAPMLGFDTAPLPFKVASGVTRVLGRMLPERRAWKGNERPAPASASRQAFLTRHADRYADELWWKAQHPALDLGPPSWGWLSAAYRSVANLDRNAAVEATATPVLIIGSDGDRLVSPAAIRRYAERIAQCELLMFDSTVAHEILRETDDIRDIALDRIAHFLDRTDKTE